MSIKVSDKVWNCHHHQFSASELLCLLALADWADDAGYCYPSMSAIAKKIRLRERQAQRVVHRLINGGFVRVIGNEFGGAPGASRKYRVILSALTGVAHVTPIPQTGVTGDTGVLDDTGVMEDADGCHGRRETGVTHDTLTVIEPSLTVSTNRALRFDEFWTAYPRCKRKGSKQKCATVWKTKKLDEDADQIIAHVNALASSDDWKKQSGQYIPAPLTYLNQLRWDGAELSPAGSGNPYSPLGDLA